MVDSLILFWHRRDLRIGDNIGLAAARQQSRKVVGVFCLDPYLLKREDVAEVRVTYMIGSLQSLKERYAEVGSQLLILQADPRQGIPALARALNAQAVFWNWDVEPYSQERDGAVMDALQEKGIRVLEKSWDQLLHAPADIRTGSQQPYTVYTPFWRNWSRQEKAAPVAQLRDVIGLTPEEQEVARQAGVRELPTAKDLGFYWDKELVIAPKEAAAQQRLVEFCDDVINEYKEQRNFPGVQGTSQLSAALKFGVIGIRTVWSATVAALAKNSRDAAQTSIQAWQQELAWREFYQHGMYNFPELATGAYRQVFRNFPYDNNQEYFQAWCEGKTGYPIVDAAMRQLNEIGWMHNRCRMIVASFLTKDLLVNPQLGEKYFSQKLIDADLSANNGGWQWSASSGMDPKPLRIFNPASQAKKFDPDGKYIRAWLPELQSIETKLLISGDIPRDILKTTGYPEPIVEHNEQQRQFKARYQQQQISQSSQIDVN